MARPKNASVHESTSRPIPRLPKTMGVLDSPPAPAPPSRKIYFIGKAHGRGAATNLTRWAREGKLIL